MSRESDADRHTRDLAAGSDTDWFESLYDQAGRGEAAVPWDRGVPSALLMEWAETTALDGAGRTAAVVGSGYGRDSEFVARLGFNTTAFDISPSAIEQTRRRFPDSPVDYAVADLFDLPTDWLKSFDLVVESMTVQSLPEQMRAEATTAVRSLVARGGTLLVVAAAPGDHERADGPPWPLTRRQVEAFAGDRLILESVEHLQDALDPSVWRWRAVLRR